MTIEMQASESPGPSPVVGSVTRDEAPTKIVVRDLDVYYGSFRAVKGVSASIRARAVTAIIGPSGCGKSTFLRALNRMHELAPRARVEGSVLLDGELKAK